MKTITIILFRWMIGAGVIFMALPSHAQESSYRFAWLSDIHIVEPENSSTRDLEQSVNDINSNNNIKFTIVTGDIADFGYDSMLVLAKSILDKLNKPYYIVPGNHDTKWSQSGATAFDRIFGHHNISFSYGNTRFIGYQTGPVLRRGDGYVTNADLEWVRLQCERARKEGKMIIPFSHYPLSNSMSNWYELTRLFRQYSVPVVLSGHWHRYRLIYADSIPNVVTRTNRSSKETPAGYTLVDITKDSIYFSKREPAHNQTVPWIALPYRLIDYSKKNITPFKPDKALNEKYSQVQVKWEKTLTAGISSEAAISGDQLFVGDRAGVMHSLSLHDGKELWRFNTAKSIFSTPAISDRKVVFGSVDGNIYCVGESDGRLIWKLKTGNYVLGSPVIDRDVVYIGASDRKFRALDLKTGKVLWVFDGLKAWVQTKPVISNGKVYFGAWDNYFYALDQQTGKLNWKWSRSSHESYPSAYYAPAACWPVAAGHKVFLAGPDMVLRALNGKTGEELWSTGEPKLNEGLGMSEDGGKVFVKCTFDSTLLAYSTNSDQPAILWKSKADYGFDDNESPIAEKNGVVFFTFRNGTVIAANSNTGKTLWEHRIGTVMLNGATPVNDREVIVTDVDGHIQLLDAGR